MTDKADELRDQLLSTFRHLAHYWAELPDLDKATGKPRTIRDRCDGLVFSILAQLDGCGDFPAFNLVVPGPPPDDLAYGPEDYEYAGVIISDMLHERFCALEREKPL